MFNDTITSRTPWQVFCFVTTVSISLATASAALAGECPADKFKANARQMVDFKPVGVTDVTLGSIDLAKQPAHIEATAPSKALVTYCGRSDPCGRRPHKE